MYGESSSLQLLGFKVQKSALTSELEKLKEGFDIILVKEKDWPLSSIGNVKMHEQNFDRGHP